MGTNRNIICYDCKGEGHIINTRTIARCCMNFNDDGGCCNYPLPDQQIEPQQCERCNGTGIIKLNVSPLEVVVSNNDNHIYISVTAPNEIILSWEQLQQIKDNHFPDKDFIEVYPKKSEVINKANVRHLVHLKNWKMFKLADAEVESEISFFREVLR